MKKKEIIFIGIVLVILIAWHIIVAGSTGKKLAGLFQAKPKPGYVWKSTSTGEERFFWKEMAVNWQPALKHPEHNVIASFTPEEWIPMAGYEIIDSKKLSTRWVPGLQHPWLKATSYAVEGLWSPNAGYVFSKDFSGNTTTVWNPGMPHPTIKIYAMQMEGQWQPYLGYQWYKTGTGSTESYNVNWTPGLVYEDIKVVTGSSENEFIPFPGYSFINRSKGVEVKWVPGTTHPDNSDLIADTEPDTWLNINAPSSEKTREPSTLGYILRSIFFGKLGELTEKHSGGNNAFSDELYKEALRNLGKGIEKGVRDN